MLRDTLISSGWRGSILHRCIPIQTGKFYNPILQTHAVLQKPVQMQSCQTFPVCMGVQRRWINPLHQRKSVCRASLYKHGNDHCNLCLAKKFAILTADPKTTFNKRTELIIKCRHRNKFKLKNLKSRLPALSSNPILTSLLLLFMQLYVDVICGVVYFKLRPVFSLSVSYFQRTV